MVKLAKFLQNIDLSGEVHLKHDWSFEISPLRLGFEPQGWDLSLETGI